MRWALGLYLAPAFLACLMRPEAISVLVPAAGPFAGRLYGHRCGMADGSPGLTLALGIFGALALVLALSFRRKVVAWLPFVLFWIGWVLGGLGSVLNTLE